MLIKRNDSLICYMNWILQRHSIGSVSMEWKISTCMLRVLLSKRLIYYFWPEDINQSHCRHGAGETIVLVFCAPMDGHGRGWTWMVNRPDEQTDPSTTTNKLKRKTFTILAIFEWPTETLSDDKTCRSASVRRTAIGNVRACNDAT